MKLFLLVAVASLCLFPTFGDVNPEEQKATVESLVEIYWANELKCPLPQFGMTREAFGIAPSKEYSLDEKATLMYRAMELRRGRSLSIQEDIANFKGTRDEKVRRSAQVKKEAFHKTDKGKKMVEFLNTRTVTPEELVEYLFEKRKKSGLKSKARTGEYVAESLDEKVSLLCTKTAEEKKARKAEAALRRQELLLRKNENGKPPVKTFKVNHKAVEK